MRNGQLFTVFVHGRQLVIGYKDATWQTVDLDNIGAGATYINVVNSGLAAGFYQRWHKYPVDGCWYTLKGRADRAAITSWPSDSSPIGTLAADQFLLKLDPATWTITQVPIEGGILALWENRYTATHPHGNAFIYVPKLECFAWFARPDGPVQLIKPPAGGTPGGDKQPPTVPANLRVTGATASSIDWAWDASSDNGGGAVAGNNVALFDAADVAIGVPVNAGNVLAYTAGGLNAGSTYKLRVSAYDNATPANESTFCAAVAGSTSAPPIDTQPPSVPANLRVTGATTSSITWAWDASTDTGGGLVAGYNVALFDGADVPIGAPVNAGNVLAYTATGLIAGTTYKLRVSAFDNATAANESAYCTAVVGATSPATGDTQPPTVPANLRVTAASSSSLTWAWDASIDNGGGSVAGYEAALYDAADVLLGPAVNVGNVPMYTASGLVAATTYKLRVAAYDDAVPPNLSAQCAAVAGSTSAATDTQPPTVPTTLRVTSVTSSSIAWAWNASTDAGGGAVAGYRVALSDKNDLPIGSRVDVGNTLAYAATGLKANTDYKLRVSAYDTAVPANESALTAAVTGRTLKKAPPGK
jgi:hypothetical protein